MNNTELLNKIKVDKIMRDREKDEVYHYQLPKIEVKRLLIKYQKMADKLEEKSSLLWDEPVKKQKIDKKLDYVQGVINCLEKPVLAKPI
jgi:hypothetical protein